MSHPRRVTLLAPAKLNLGLRLLARRDDGYHEIDTVFLPLHLHDELVMEDRPGQAGIEIAVEIDADTVPPSPSAGIPRDDSNLAVRAARAALRALGWGDAGLSIRLRKRIPVAAGLGGGSSDAAAAILGVEALAEGNLGGERRRAIAREIGADVPFFLEPRPARGRGIGDQLESLAGVPEMHWVLVALDFGVSTPWAYAEASGRVELPRIAGAAPDGLSAGTSGGQLPADLQNDLEPAVAARHPAVARSRRALERAGAGITGMSGSGPTVYGRLDTAEEARRVASELELPPGARALAVRSAGSGE